MAKRLIIATVVGARPQFIKCAAFSRHWRKRHREILIHTGQHYDAGLSDIFFREMRIPKPDVHLNAGGGSHGEQTGRMLEKLDRLFRRQSVQGVLIYGDTNSTLAGALAASKLHIPIFHVESGLRSFNRRMPEEINRVVADQLSSLLFVPTQTAIHNLRREGITRGVHQVGGIMLDVFKFYEPLAQRERRDATWPHAYALATIHRAESTDSKSILSDLCRGLESLPIPVVWPIHPRTRQALKRFGIRPGRNIHIIEPVGYLDSLRLQKGAEVILTDSGGLQKEAYFLHKPCVTLREETEWTETVKSGHNILAGYDPARIRKAFEKVQCNPRSAWPSYFGSGNSSLLMTRAIEKFLR